MFVKKRFLYAERCEQKRADFTAKIGEILPEKILYLDESGIDARLENEHYWGKKKIVRTFNKNGNRSKCKRFSLISGLINRTKLIAQAYYGRYTNTQVFNEWIKTHLLPAINGQNMTIVMDNASFHKSKITREMLENAGHKILFLPPYSPDLNPIEQKWSHIKTKIRHIKTNFPDF
jgi:transposase